MNDVPYSPRHAEAVLPVSLRTVSLAGNSYTKHFVGLSESVVKSSWRRLWNKMNNERTMLSKEFKLVWSTSYLLKYVCLFFFVDISSTENVKRSRHNVMNSETSRLRNMPRLNWLEAICMITSHTGFRTQNFTSSERCAISPAGQISVTINTAL